MRDEFKSYCHEGAHPSVVINNRDDLTKEETIQVLENIKKTIKSETIGGYDCTAIGAKNTECSWGFCDDRKEHYPNPEMHTFPQDFADSSRISHLNTSTPCPLKFENPKKKGWGCFYHCRFFQGHIKTPTKEEAIELYDTTINKLTEDLCQLKKK